MSNNREEMIKAAEDLLRMEAINSTQWRTLSEKVADFAAEQIATQTAELKKQVAAANKGAKVNAHVNQSLVAQLADAQAEIKRLREALGRLTGADCPYGDCSCRWMHIIAEQALEQENQQEGE